MIFLDGQQVFFSKFPNGETRLNQINELHISYNNHLKTTFIYESDQDLINLMILKQWLDVHYNDSRYLQLEILYMPYSRMDRKIDYHEPTLHTMLNYLKYLNFNNYIVYDPHSNEELYTYLGFHVVNQLKCTLGKVAYQNIHDHSLMYYTRNNITVLAPDKGAEKKSLEVANYYDLPFMIALKVRDVITGDITNTQILGNVIGKNLFIFDDIIDGGATFIELAKIAKANGANDLYLYATHGIFSKGTLELEKYFKHIFVYHTFMKECDSKNITVLRKEI
jgi:ribose-phosphate pyrophosphokinase